MHFPVAFYRSLFIIGMAAAWGCGGTRWVPSRAVHELYDVSTSSAQDTAMLRILQPYADSVDKTMNRVIGHLAAPLTKSWPGCSLGQFMTDAYLQEAQKAYNRKVDLAFMNTGGIRLNSMEPGPITISKIFELMPFDNVMILMELSGSQLQQLLTHFAARGGWPMSGGSYRIANQAATDVRIGGMPLALEKVYTIAISDYVANGGDDSNILKGLPQINNGYLQRDALLAYVKGMAAQGLSVQAPAQANVVR